MTTVDKANELRRLAQALKDAAGDPIAVTEIAATINQRAIDILELEGAEVLEPAGLQPKALDDKDTVEVTPITNDTGAPATIPGGESTTAPAADEGNDTLGGAGGNDSVA